MTDNREAPDAGVAAVADGQRKSHTKLKVIAISAFILLLVGSLLTYFVIYPNYQYHQYKKNREFFWCFVYAYDFQMAHAANPEIEGSPDGIGRMSIVDSNLAPYSSIEFAMELPPPEQRKRGVIYIAPDQSGKTQERLDYFNSMFVHIGSVENGTDFPLTIEALINDRQLIMSDTLYMEVSHINRLSEPEWQKEREILYAKIFLLQATCSEPKPDGVNQMDKDRYVSPVSKSENFSLTFTATPPSDSEMAARSFYLYPHEDGHTDTLIANLNGIIAEQPELLDGTGLAAPLTLDNVLNDRESVWKIIHRLDSGQIARFRTH